MRYAYRLSDGTEIRQKLDAETVARFAADGIPLAILRRRHYRRGTEQHVGEYTDREHAAMLANGWELVKVLADDEQVEPPPAPPPVDPYPAWRDHHRDGLTAFRAAFLATMYALGQAGVPPPNPLTFRDLLALLSSLPGDEWTRRAVLLRGAYDEVLFACSGNPQMAYKYLPQILADESLA